MEQERSFFKQPWLWLIFSLYLALAAFSFNRGLLLSDEAFPLYYSWLITRGQKIYKDFFITTAPLSYLIQAWLIKIFGLKMIVSKINAALIGVAGFFAIAYISKKIGSRKMVDFQRGAWHHLFQQPVQLLPPYRDEQILLCVQHGARALLV